METKELQDIIKRGETSAVQFKEIFTNQKDFSKEVVAMANSLGGIIVIGVKDKTGEIRGLDYNEIQEWSREIGNVANEQIRPTIYLQTEVVEVNGKMLLVVHVKEGVNKPYKDLNGSIWIKQSADKRRITDNDEILRLFAQSGTYHADCQIVRGTSLSDLDMYRIDDFFERVYKKPKEQFGIPFDHLMQNLKIADANDNLTLSGLLFFGKRPQQFVPEFCVKAVAFYGNSIGGTEYRDSKDIVGTIPDMYEQCLRFCEMNLHRVQAGQNFNSIGKLEVSQVAIEEIMQNALVHRDYIIPAAIRLLIFDNRIEIVSPGSLPNGMTTDLIRMGVSCPRNPLMATLCAKIMPYRGLGSGIVRAEQDGAEMEFKNIDNIQLTTILKRKETEQNLGQVTMNLRQTYGELVQKLTMGAKVLIIMMKDGEYSAKELRLTPNLPRAYPELTQSLLKTYPELAQSSLPVARESFKRQILEPLLKENIIEQTIPDKPRHPNQRYRLTDKGKEMYKILTETKPQAL